MKKFVLNHRKRWTLSIAIFQLLGALVSLYLIFTVVANNGISFAVVFAVLPILGITLVSLFAGIFYFIKGEKNELRFFTLSKLNFCVHFLQLAVPGFAFIYYYGPYLAFGFDGDFSFLLRFQTLTINFAFSIGSTDGEHEVLFNIIPIIPLLALRWIERNPVESPDPEKAFVEEG